MDYLKNLSICLFSMPDRARKPLDNSNKYVYTSLIPNEVNRSDFASTTINYVVLGNHIRYEFVCSFHV